QQFAASLCMRFYIVVTSQFSSVPEVAAQELKITHILSSSDIAMQGGSLYSGLCFISPIFLFTSYAQPFEYNLSWKYIAPWLYFNISMFQRTTHIIDTAKYFKFVHIINRYKYTTIEMGFGSLAFTMLEHLYKYQKPLAEELLLLCLKECKEFDLRALINNIHFIIMGILCSICQPIPNENRKTRILHPKNPTSYTRLVNLKKMMEKQLTFRSLPKDGHYLSTKESISLAKSEYTKVFLGSVGLIWTLTHIRANREARPMWRKHKEILDGSNTL
ncbi:hypothetical protein ACJX0J_030134, partial [Zea mays]